MKPESKSVYVATKFENQEVFHKCHNLLTLAGHRLIHDWTKESDVGMKFPEVYAYRQKCACNDFMSAAECQVLIMIPVPVPMAGAFVELGLALRNAAKIIIVDAWAEGNQRNIFYYLPNVIHVKTIEEAVSAI